MPSPALCRCWSPAFNVAWFQCWVNVPLLSLPMPPVVPSVAPHRLRAGRLHRSNPRCLTQWLAGWLDNGTAASATTAESTPYAGPGFLLRRRCRRRLLEDIAAACPCLAASPSAVCVLNPTQEFAWNSIQLFAFIGLLRLHKPRLNHHQSVLRGVGISPLS